jgi:hypothetical protein
LLVQQQTVIRESTIDNNYGKLGGGIYVDGGTVELHNSTIAKNSTVTDGGAVYVGSGTINVYYSTIADNETWQGSNTGGIYNFGDAVNLYHSLLDLNRAGVVSDNCEGSINTTSYNLIFGTSGCTLNANTKNILGISSPLNALASNGGPTQTMSLQMGSAAIDVIPANKCLDAKSNPLTRDQRGKPRPADGNADNKKKCDLGAYEAQP